MTVSNGQLANQTTFNNAFLSKIASQSDTIAKIGLTNSDSVSGTSITNTQREINSIASFAGKAVNEAKDYLPVWVTNNVGASGDNLFERIKEIDLVLDPDYAGFLEYRASCVEIPNGDNSIDITFGASMSSSGYALNVTFENLTDSNPQFLSPLITARSAAGFSIRFNAGVDSANYKLHYEARTFHD